MQKSVLLFVLGLCLSQTTSASPWCSGPLSILCDSSKCPPQDFDSVADFDVEKYISAPWFIQEQMTNSFQREDDLFCVRAKYELLEEGNFSGGLRVFNYGNSGQVNGPSMGSVSDDDGSFSELRAIIPDESIPSKLKVGPPFLESLFGSRIARTLFGPYWVVAVGESKDKALGYDWAIVSGGAPKVETDNGCRTGRQFLNRFQVNGVGLWLFSRKPVDPENTSIMRAKAAELGFDTSVLLPVEQKGCKYEGARP